MSPRQKSDFTSLEQRGCESLQIQPRFFLRTHGSSSPGKPSARRVVIPPIQPSDGIFVQRSNLMSRQGSYGLSRPLSSGTNGLGGNSSMPRLRNSESATPGPEEGAA